MTLFPGFESRIADVGEAEIYYHIGGVGPPVLLLHGYPQTSAMWARVAPILAENFTVVCSDLRGYGDSSKPASAPDHAPYSFRSMAADQVRLMSELGFATFHLVGHDRGARTAHRAALDHPRAVRSLAVLDIVPTATVLDRVDRHTVFGYWHWFFLSLPRPMPETMIDKDPDFFFTNSIATWGGGSTDDFDPELLSEYRRCWSDPGMVHSSCEDYRAAITIDSVHDRADQDHKLTCPTLALSGARGLMARNFDIADAWRQRCVNLKSATIDGGHFFVDERPAETADVLSRFLTGCEQSRVAPISENSAHGADEAADQKSRARNQRSH